MPKWWRLGLVLIFMLIGSAAALWHSGALPFVANGQPEASLELTLTAVGDLVVHLPIITSAYDSTSKTYDFRPVLAGVREQISSADLAVATLEIPLSGPERSYTGYPAFNSPYSLADGLQWAGFDLVFTASNHSLDQGFTGLQSTQAYLDQIGLAYSGSRRSQEQPRFKLLEVKGTKLAFLSYTTLTNGLSLPAGQEWALNLLNPKDLAPLAAEIQAARRAGAELVIVALHSGTEYQRLPEPERQQLFNRVLAAGADIILGSHVHVMGPLETKTIVDPITRQSRNCLIVYSLGNFLSNQYWRYSDCGLVVTVRLTREPGTARLVLGPVEHFPVWVDRQNSRGQWRYRILKLDGSEASRIDPDLSPADRARMAQVWQETEELLKKWPPLPPEMVKAPH